MKLPRDISGAELVKRLCRLGYEVERQTGSHIRLKRLAPIEQWLTVPFHAPIKPGTLNAIVRVVADQLGISRNDAMARLFN